MKKQLLLPVFFALLLFHCACTAQVNWSAANSGLPASSYVNGFISTSGGTIYTVLNASDQGYLYSSSDGGNSWNSISTSGLPTGAWANSLFITGSTLLLGSNTLGSSLYASGDNGQTWSASNSGLPSGADVNSFAATTNGTIFITVNASLQGQLYSSSNGGSSWNSVSTTGLPTGAWGNSIFAIGNTLLLGSNTLGSGLYISNDNGQTWSASNSGLPSGADVNGFATSDGTIYITVNASDQGQLYSSTDGGSSWSSVYTTGLPSGAWAKSIFISGGIGLLGSNGMGSYLYSSNVSTGITETSAPVLLQFTLYPNPSTGTMQLSISKELIGSELDIYDEEGRLVFHSKLETQNSQLDLGLASGIYFATLKSATGVATQKLVIER